MADKILTQEKKRYTNIVVIYTEYSDLDIDNYLICGGFLYQIQIQLEAVDGNISTVCKSSRVPKIGVKQSLQWCNTKKVTAELLYLECWWEGD